MRPWQKDNDKNFDGQILYATVVQTKSIKIMIFFPKIALFEYKCKPSAILSFTIAININKNNKLDKFIKRHIQK